jgi:hypothetical protein
MLLCTLSNLLLLTAALTEARNNFSNPVEPKLATSDPGPGGSDPGKKPLVVALSSSSPPKQAIAITRRGGYSLTGASNVYAVYYGRSDFFNAQSGQEGGEYTMNGNSFTDALDEFLKYFGKSNIPQWNVITSHYSGIGELTFKKSVRISDTTNSIHYLGGPSFYGYTVFDSWFTNVLKSNLLPDDPDRGIYMIIIAEGESLRSSASDKDSYVISSSGQTKKSGDYADCAVHHYTTTKVGTRYHDYFWGIVGIPQSGDRSNNCYTRNEEAMGMIDGRASFIKRNGVMSGIAHELMEIVTDPYNGNGWYGGKQNDPVQNADNCALTYLNTFRKTLGRKEFNVNTKIGDSWYMIQGSFNPRDNKCY